MQLTGMLHGAALLRHVGFPVPEILGPDASEAAIQALIARHGTVFVKPVFKGGVGKKGKAGLVGRATTLREALAEKERLYFAEHCVGELAAKANGVTFEAGIPAEHEVYFSITDSTEFRAPTITLTHCGGMDIEELDPSEIACVPFDALDGNPERAPVASELLQQKVRARSHRQRNADGRFRFAEQPVGVCEQRRASVGNGGARPRWCDGRRDSVQARLEQRRAGCKTGDGKCADQIRTVDRLAEQAPDLRLVERSARGGRDQPQQPGCRIETNAPAR